MNKYQTNLTVNTMILLNDSWTPIDLPPTLCEEAYYKATEGSLYVVFRKDGEYKIGERWWPPEHRKAHPASMMWFNTIITEEEKKENIVKVKRAKETALSPG